jgi:hypothetical protein
MPKARQHLGSATKSAREALAIQFIGISLFAVVPDWITNWLPLVD